MPDAVVPRPMSVPEKIVSFGRPLKAPELAKILGIPKDQVYVYTRNSTIPSYRVGNAIRYDPPALLDWFAKQ